MKERSSRFKTEAKTTGLSASQIKKNKAQAILQKSFYTTVTVKKPVVVAKPKTAEPLHALKSKFKKITALH
jgi:hypothetical protein